MNYLNVKFLIAALIFFFYTFSELQAACTPKFGSCNYSKDCCSGRKKIFIDI